MILVGLPTYIFTAVRHACFIMKCWRMSSTTLNIQSLPLWSENTAHWLADAKCHGIPVSQSGLTMRTKPPSIPRYPLNICFYKSQNTAIHRSILRTTFTKTLQHQRDSFSEQCHVLFQKTIMIGWIPDGLAKDFWWNFFSLKAVNRNFSFYATHCATTFHF